MKVTAKVIRNLGILLSTALLAFSTACSSSQQDEEDLELSEEENNTNQQGNLGEDDAAEGNGQENYENEEQASENEQGAEVNSETENEFEEGNELGGEQTAQGNEVFNNGGNATANAGMNGTANAGMNTSAPMNAAAAMNAGMGTPAPAPAPVASEKAPIPGGRVRYVREGGVQVVSGPGGSPVASLEQGDHPVTWEENGWLRISNGMYVPVDAMSDKGVPRVMGQKGWN